MKLRVCLEDRKEDHAAWQRCMATGMRVGVVVAFGPIVQADFTAQQTFSSILINLRAQKGTRGLRYMLLRTAWRNKLQL